MMAGQTINDRLLAARHSIAGQGLAKSVCKATTEEMIGPKKKHLDYLVQCTNEPNVSIPQLANLLIERAQNANWIVVYKALITVHHMMCYGNERFTQYLASSNSTFQLNHFLDKSGLQGYDMSPFIRRYARYLNEKALSYRTVAFDFCKVKRGKEDGTLRTMNAERLLKTLPTLHQQLVALLLFDCEANNLTNGVINMSFMLLFRDLIRLFACYNDGVINLLEKYFDMNKKQCKEALDLYKEFLQGMDNVAEFLKVAENVGIDKGEIPDLTKAPSSLLGALEQHLASLDGKKSSTSTPTQSATTAFGAAVTNGTNSASNGIDESLKQQLLAEEEAAMNQYKSKLQSPNTATNPFLSNPMLNNNPQPQVMSTVDLFAPAPAPGSLKHEPFNNRASEDLLQLNNPFADVFGAPQSPTIANNIWITNGNGLGPQTATPFVTESNFNSVFGTTDSTAQKSVALEQESVVNVQSDLLFNCNSSENVVITPPGEGRMNKPGPPPRPPPPSKKPTPVPDEPFLMQVVPGVAPYYLPQPVTLMSLTSPSESLNNIPNTSQNTAMSVAAPTQIFKTPEQGFDGLGSVLQPAGSISNQNNSILANNVKNNQQSHHGSSALLTGDLESSLASLAENLSINKGPPPVKSVQWNSPKNGAKPGASWTPQPMAATTGAGYRPMGQGMTSIPPQPMFTQIQPMGMRPMVAGQGMMAPMVIGAAAPGPQPAMAQQQSLLFH